MKFGGHNSFYIRPGWLSKGLFLVQESSRTNWSSTDTSDALGVGSNMAKSIGWWLNATDLVRRPSRREPLELTEFGRVIADHDPYLSDIGSWWFIHLNLVFNAWNAFQWFFTRFRRKRFSRELAIQALRNEARTQAGKIRNLGSVQREIGALLQSYSRQIPNAPSDPEDNLDCPLRSLGLLIYQTEIGEYVKRKPVVSVPPEVIGAMLVRTAKGAEGMVRELPLDQTEEASVAAASLNFDLDYLSSAVAEGQDILGPGLITRKFLANSRVATVEPLPPSKWAKRYFNRNSKQSTPTDADLAVTL